jgi:MFS family permease
LSTAHGQIGAFQAGWLTITPLAVLIVVRFLLGAGEAGAYPNITRALHNWFPMRQRGLAQGVVWMCGRLMGGLTPLVWMVLVEGMGRPRRVRVRASSGALVARVDQRESVDPLPHVRLPVLRLGLLHGDASKT